MSDIEKAVEGVDEAVPLDDSPALTVLPDTSRWMPWIGVGFAVCAALTLPWSIYLGATLPARELSTHYDVAWSGFDVMLFVALASTAYAVLRRTPWVGMCAGAAAALLVADAWFDLVTAPDTSALVAALAMAALVELPLAGTCVWLCRHANDLADRRIRHLLPRGDQRAR
jgi:hypothetical protein